LDSIRVALPIRFKILYDDAVTLVENIKDSQPETYDISSDCDNYGGLINVHLKDSDDGSSKIIQFEDFSTYNEKYFNSYIFQFAVKNVNVDGDCAS